MSSDKSTPATYANWLKKKGARANDGYSKRWGEVRGDKLFYFKKTSDKEPKGFIELADSEIVMSSEAHGFALRGKHLSRTYFLTAMNDQERDAWWKAIQAAIEASSTKIEESKFIPRSRTTSVFGKKEVTLEDFKLLTVIGRGSFGKVMKVMKKDTHTIYAMKALHKRQILEKDLVLATKLEKSLLSTLRHPYVVRLHYAFQDDEKLYLILDFLSGGELFFHLSENGVFGESRTRLYTAQIGSALEFLHECGICYRDLKPENIVLDRFGHCVLCDFGLAKKDMTDANDATRTFCGTPEYLAPEILKGGGYTKAVDWWSLGILTYEMIVGLPPFYSQSTKEMYDMILHKDLSFPPFVSPEAKDFITLLLQRDPEKRMTATQFKSHPWMKAINWEELLARKIKPEFVPKLREEGDVSYFDSEFTSEELKRTVYEGKGGKGGDLQHAGIEFSGFDFHKEGTVHGHDETQIANPTDVQKELKKIK